MTYDFSLRDQIDYKIGKIGPEEIPLILIDGLLQDPESLIRFAESEAAYGPAGAAYPGIRAPIPGDYPQHLNARLHALMCQVFAVPASIAYKIESTFALVTDPAPTLHHVQRVPHVDRSGPYNLAMVHYLCGPEFGGTSFFRHKASGWQRINNARKEEYDRWLSRELTKQVLPPAFPGEGHPLFDRMATIDSGFDRLVIYPASMLHSPAINTEAVFTADPRSGRLTITSFLDPIE